MPSFIIVGHVWKILEREGLFTAPPPSPCPTICEAPWKAPSWKGLRQLRDAREINKRLFIWRMFSQVRSHKVYLLVFIFPQACSAQNTNFSPYHRSKYEKFPWRTLLFYLEKFFFMLFKQLGPVNVSKFGNDVLLIAF